MPADEKEIIVKNLQTLSIHPAATQVYLQLAIVGSSSALQLAKLTKITRTQVYRHLDVLQEKGLVSAEPLSYGTLFRALPLENIERLIAQREAETIELKNNLDIMTSLMQKLVENKPKATVRHYYGLDGIKQANWNLTKAKKEYRVLEVAHLSHSLDTAFAQRCRERYIERGLTCYALTNSRSVEGREIAPYDITHDFFRSVHPSVLAINFETYIYDNVVTLLDYTNGREMAVEIHHSALSVMMRQLFDAIWAQATPLVIKEN